MLPAYPPAGAGTANLQADRSPLQALAPPQEQIPHRRAFAMLGIGFSIFLFVVGAILTFAVNVSVEGFNLNTVGIILMVAGVIGLLLSLLFWSSFSPYRRRPSAPIPRSEWWRSAGSSVISPDHQERQTGHSSLTTGGPALAAHCWGRAARERRQRAAPPASWRFPRGLVGEPGTRRSPLLQLLTRRWTAHDARSGDSHRLA
jgi:hypothetical protein